MPEDELNRCEKHDVDIAALPDDYDFCPYCREEQKREDRIRHDATRDPTIEPY